MVTANSRIGAVVLAGGSVPSSLANLCAHRALLRLHERYLLEYLLDTLQEVSSIVATALVVPHEALDAFSGAAVVNVAAGESIVDNMQRGAHALTEHQPTHLLFITGDIPLVTVEGLEAYIRTSLESHAALTYPIIPKDICEQRFPGAKRTYVKIKEGTFTGGNAIFTEATLLNDKHALIQQLYNARKDPLKLAGILGWPTIIRMLSGTLAIPYLESVASHILDSPVRAIITPYAEIGFDVDKAEDLAIVERTLAEAVQP